MGEGRANLCFADLNEANLAKAQLWGANLYGANLTGANLSEADLYGVNLRGAKLSRADLSRATLYEAVLRGANLAEASLTEADLRGAYLIKADLTAADLQGADLTWADLTGANLTGAVLRVAKLQGANLTEADLSDADLSKADLNSANLSRARYQIESQALPEVSSIAYANGIETMRGEDPQAFVELRNALKNAGYREAERKITYAYKHGEIANNWRGKEPAYMADAAYKYVLFDLPAKWGLQPWRALLIMILLIPFFAIVYAIVISRPGDDGIWRHWPEKRSRKEVGSDKPEQLRARPLQAYVLGLQFSALSAFHIGWRDLNVGTWLSRLQRREYTLRATGWARTFSGLQSLISLYLLVMWFLTLFGRPFE